ncbi:chloride channel protein [Danxiaibacter flavus]|uniref:Chloride channel protein n=1 Tax=Danxiaibacter flavus TaxID=3049108 RepID=A0ABV3ZCR9_9BACT|nr:chloride channel protein [Chitinophagaceae bacterium DXS]
MRQNSDQIPLSTSLNIFPAQKIKKQSLVNKRVLYLSLQAILNAIVIGFVARLLVYLIDLITNLAFYGKFSIEPASPARNGLGLAVIFIPVAGSIIVGFIARYGSKAIRGHGIPEAMEKIILDDSKIPPSITFLKPLSAAISIGTGGPFGAEGPIIATGGAFGSFTGQIMHISASERKIILSAGACAGMSAIFGSPLAAVLLAIELLLFEFSPKSIIPVALACVTGAAMHLLLFGSSPVFAMSAIPVASGGSLIIYAAMGLVIGVIASLISKSVYAVEDAFEKLPIHWMWWPAIGAIAVGIVGYFAPFTMGVGYENIQHLLSGKLPLTLLISLCFLKYISWVISLGSGTSGGTLAPLFTIGGALGALLGVALLNMFPSLQINLATAALIGMAAMFAGASRALLTSIVFALETTGQSNGLLPLLAACAAAYFVSFFMMKGSIMTEKIQRRGVSTPDEYEADLLKHARAKDLITVAADNDYNGLPFVYATDDLSFCMEVMGRYETDAVAVVSNTPDQKIMGKLTSSAIVKHYSRQKELQHSYNSPKHIKRLLVRGRRIMNKA